MNPTPLMLWGQGAVTLPKEWRDRCGTKIFMAIETPAGLLIKPIVETEYYENSPTDFGLRFPRGMDARMFLECFKKADEKVQREESRSQKRRKRHGSH